MLNTYRQYQTQSMLISKEYVDEQDSIFRYEVRVAIDDIEFRKLFGEGLQKNRQERMIAWLSNIRFPNRGNNPGFFFIRALDGRSILSISTPELIGQNISDLKDPDGIVTHDLFMKVLEEGNGEGFANYSWFNPDTRQVERKRSYIKLIPGWNSYLGSGFWLDDIQSVIDKRNAEILAVLRNQLLIMITIMLFFSISAILVSRLFRKKMVNNFNHFINFFQKASNSTALIDLNTLEYSEFQEIAEYANEMSIKRNHAENKTKQALSEKEILLRELYHRTKNNMQVIISLLNMKAQGIGNNDLELIFLEIQNKIHSMALVHEKLYQSNNLSNIELDDYIIELCNDLKNSYNTRGKNLTFVFNLEKFPILIDFALPIGLILSELISNSFKHAFINSDIGEITISLSKREETISLEFGDNGRGFPDDFNYKKTETLGIQTIIALAENQLNGKIHLNGDMGLKCIIKFTDQGYSPRI